MRPEFPKPAREALARQTAGDPHPSADLLNAYAEQSLTPGERTHVVAHLAVCEECREVVFLAGGCVDEAPVFAPAVEPVLGWRRWRWAVPAVALVAIVSAVLVQHIRTTRPATSPTVLTAANQPPQAQPESSNASTKLEASPAAPPATFAKPSAKARSSPAATRAPASGQRPSTEVASAGQLALRLSGGSQPAASVAAPPQAVAPATASQNVEIASAEKATGTSPPTVLRMAPSAATAAPLQSDLRPMSPAAPGKVSPPSAMLQANRSQIQLPARWRITPDGHLERSIANGAWGRVLADHPVAFHVVSVVGNEVWAGGSKGALFHSRDGGTSWQPVLITSASKAEDGNIVAIVFETPEQGSVTTDTGVKWSTSDGGQNWTKQ